MAKAQRGRGYKAPYQTKMVRTPEPIKTQVEQLIELYHQSVADGGDPLNPELLLKSQSLTERLREIVDKINSSESGYRRNSACGLVREIRELLSSLEN